MSSSKWRAALGCSVLLASDLMAGSATSADYSLPRDKSSIEPCKEAALAARPGQIERFQVKHVDGRIHYLFEIEDQQRKLWTVVCDGAARKVVEITGAD